MGSARSADLYEFDPEQTRKAPFRVRVRTTLPFLGSRFESVRTITVSDEVPGVSCRHTLTGYVRVRFNGPCRSQHNATTHASDSEAVRAHVWHGCMLECLQLTCCLVGV